MLSIKIPEISIVLNYMDDISIEIAMKPAECIFADNNNWIFLWHLI